MADSIVNAEAKLAATAALMSSVVSRLARAAELLEEDSEGSAVPGALALVSFCGSLLDRGAQGLGELGYSTADEWLMNPAEIAALETMRA